MLKHLKNQRGMTLIEIIVVMAIIALFTSIVATQVTGRLAQAKIDSTKTQIKMLSQALELYKADNDYYPTTDQGLEALITKPTTGNVPTNYPADGYLQKSKLPKDGWGQPFVYISEDGNAFTILSYGADKKEGGSDKGADVSSDDI
ncbi:MAG: type II secretion system protein GspG [Deltaproteobacteria bacterium RIFCSPHIGHO2_02_FULL_40_11]|nr:MAG: type II secretion system protein GspG [Deltaproteobacteria bacterium RIFCSPHIGHO2_02_FULL_40_11]